MSNNKIRVYIITTAHPYNDVRVTHRIGRSFVENGLEVYWFGPLPNGIPLPLYGIKFFFFRRNANRLGRYTSWIKLKRLLSNQTPADIYFAVDPDSGKVANFYARMYRTRSVFDIHEIFHKDMLHLHVHKFLVPLLGVVVKHQVKDVCRKSSLVVGVGETRIKPYRKVIKQSLIVRHCVPLEFAKGARAEPLKNASREVLVMQGKVSRNQGTLQLLLAAKMASIILGLNVKIILFKIFSQDLSNQEFNKFIEINSLEKQITMMDPVPFENMFSILSNCDIGVISYQRQMGIECMPNRIFEYMAVGLPTLVPSYAIEMQEIIKKYNCGISANMEDINDISEKIIDLVSKPKDTVQMGSNGLSAFLNGCNWEDESRPLIDWIKRK